MTDDPLRVIDTLRLTPEKCEALLREARQLDEPGATRRERTASRFSFADPQGFVLRIEQHGGGTHDYRVIGRNISRGGIAVFHGQVVYPNTRCMAILRTNAGTSVSLPCTVVYCHHFRARIHEIGLRFDKPIDVNLFLEPAPVESCGAEHRRAVLVAAAHDLLALVQTDDSPERIRAALERMLDCVDAAEHAESPSEDGARDDLSLPIPPL